MEGRESPLCYYVFDLLQLDGKNLRGLPLTSRKEVAAATLRRGGRSDSLFRRTGRRRRPRSSAKSSGAASRGSSASWRIRFMSRDDGAARGSSSRARTNRNSSSAVTLRRPARGSISARCSSVTTKRKSCSSPARSALVSTTKYSPSCIGNCKPKRAMIVRLLISRQDRAGNGCRGSRPAMMRKIHWVNPVFVCQVKFSEWTREGKLRQPVFLGLREDKNPSEVRRE